VSAAEPVDRILDAVRLDEGPLLLIQFALKKKWGRLEGDQSRPKPTQVGGIAGAIEKTAEDAYERLTPSEKAAARCLFPRHAR
jgi:hypothetical protein